MTGLMKLKKLMIMRQHNTYTLQKKGKFGEVYVCPKEYVEKYKNILICTMIRKNCNKIIELQNQNDKLENLFLTNID